MAACLTRNLVSGVIGARTVLLIDDGKNTCQAILPILIVTNAKTPQVLGKVVASLKPKLQGRAAMSLVSRKVKDALSRG